MSARRTGALAGLIAIPLIALAGCGGGDDAADLPAATAPAAAAPVAIEAVPPGGSVTAGPATPRPVARALKGSGVVVVAFVVGNTADDDDVAAAVAEVRKDRDAARGVAFFTYRVGRDSFGDLADRLGITGSPSVAVIGRDRTLVNLWTGLVDADILRQSISDAADRPAANPGKAAVGGGGTTPTATGPTGNAEGIAVLKKANASYATVPGVRVEGVFASGGQELTADALVALDDGRVTGVSGTFTAAGRTLEVSVGTTTARIRAQGASCWAAAPKGQFSSAQAPRPTVDLAGARVGPPRTEGDATLIDVTSDGTTATMVVESATNVVRELRSPAGTLRFTELDEAPAIADGTPVCDTPSDALEGLDG